jgi:membrane protease YdiL (CAAX protease family)
MRASTVVAGGGPSLLLAAALVPGLRPVVAVVLLAGWLLLLVRRRPEALTWAATLPVGVPLVWPWVLGVDVPLGEVACVAPFSDIVLRRMVVAAVGLGLAGLVSVVHRVDATELGLRRPGRTEAAAGLGGLLVLGIGGPIIGPIVAEPFFGPLEYATPAAVIVPAVLFGIANGVLEEVAYRGVLQAFLGRLVPIGAVIAFQGLVFGIVHAGPEVVALLPLHIAMLSAVGVAAGIARWRLGSLWIPIGIHVGADIALYVGLACRSAA